MGLKGQSNALQVEVDAEGRIKYDVVLKQGGAQGNVIHHQLTDLLPKQVLRDDDLQKPDEQTVEETKEAKRATSSGAHSVQGGSVQGEDPFGLDKL